MKRVSFCAALALAAAGSAFADAPIASASFGGNEIRLYAEPLSYMVLRAGTVLAGKTPIGLRLEGDCPAAATAPVVTEYRRDGSVSTPVYKKSAVDLSCAETLVDFGPYAVRLAARADGVAYRFELKGGCAVKDEMAGLVVPAGARCWFNRTPRNALGREETVPECDAAEELPADPDMAFYLPFVYSVAGKTVAVTESDVRGYPVWNFGDVSKTADGTRLSSLFAKWPKDTYRARNGATWNDDVVVPEGGRWVRVKTAEDYLARSDAPRTLPWRVFILADEPAKLCEADIVYSLASPVAQDADFSWVKPGKVAWDWWNAFDNKGDPEGCTTETYERFIDFAAQNGVEYVILDEGWSESLNIWKFHPNVDVPRLIARADEKGVGIILWMAWAQIVGEEEKVAEHFAKLGAKGFKVDFMDRGDGAVADFMEKFAAACAKNRMLVDYHGSWRPTGLQRAYPNIVNYEGIHGLENMKSYYESSGDFMANDVRAFFLRMTAGPLDYTPGAMDNYPLNGYGGSVFNPGSLGTRCRQMAMMVLFEAPLQMLCDAPTKYEKNAECFSFMAATPTVWSETVGLGGSPDTYAAVARRAKDGAWYAAAMTGRDARDVAFSMAFLGEGEWTAEVFRDADDADASPTHFVHETRTVAAGETMAFRLAPGGGFVVRFAPAYVGLPGRAVWIKGAGKEMNAFYGFSAAFDVRKGEHPVLRLSAGSIARAWVNGKFAGYGPARAPEGYMRLDEWPLDGLVAEGRNVIAIEVSNPAVNTFYLPEQDGFLFAEVVVDGRVLAATVADADTARLPADGAFKAMRLPRVQKTSRFSYQREFAEFYAVTPDSDAWRTNGVDGAGLPLAEVPLRKMLPRGAPYPVFAFDGTFRPTVRTSLRRDPGHAVKPLVRLDKSGWGPLRGFKKETHEVNFSDAIQTIAAGETVPSGAAPFALKGFEGVVFEGERNTAGFPKIELRCESPATVWLVMDELAGPDGLPDPVRYLSCVNACGWRLETPGRYTLECFQPYVLKYAHVIVEGGAAEVLDFNVRTYVNPAPSRASFRCSDPALEKVFAAAAQSLACNAVDAFTDCPGRERGVYFGDTVFTARGAETLLGDTAMERVQFENYALAPRFPGVPDGMLPMLYPGDTTLAEAHWIPNFCMWAVIQLADYVRRSGDSAMAAAFRPRAEGVLATFRRSLDGEGLLEDLPGWVFIEWSDAEKFTDGVNYPSNMIYIRFLEAFASLYGDEGCRAEAARLKDTVRRLSWNGEWFRDHSVRGADGALAAREDCTEICQYLAFYSGVATAESHPELWRRLVDDMGPLRKAGAHPEVHRSNLLFGYSLRFLLLSESGFSARVLDELKGCYLPMAEKTGTLWESVSSDGFSCCHGFPCMAAWLLARDALGVKAVDRVAKTVVVAPPEDVPLEWCEGTVPVSDGEAIHVSWRKVEGHAVLDVELPSGWTRKPFENTFNYAEYKASGFKLKHLGEVPLELETKPE